MARIGRKPFEDREQIRIPVSVSFTRKELDYIDECAAQLRISRTTFINNVVKNGMDDARLMKSLGFFKVVGKVRKLMDEREKQRKLPLKP